MCAAVVCDNYLITSVVFDALSALARLCVHLVMCAFV